MPAPDADDPLPTMDPKAAQPPAGTPNGEPDRLPAPPSANLVTRAPAPTANAAATLRPGTPSGAALPHAAAGRQSIQLSGPVSVTGLVLRWQEACERGEMVSVEEVLRRRTGVAGRGTATH